MSDDVSAPLRREIDKLGRRIGETIARFAGAEGLALVETVRKLTRKLRQGDDAAADELHRLLAELAEDRLSIVIRGFSIFLELANLAEDRQRARVLRQRESEAYPAPRKESVRAAVAKFYDRGLSTAEVQKLVDRTHIELVLTAHPTEAKRRSVRRILRRIHELLGELDAPDLTPRSRDRLKQSLTSQLELLWQTDLLRPFRPTPMEEVERGLAFQHVLWEELPVIINDLRTALAEYYPKVTPPTAPIIRYGSWIGGDRDGNPFVTPDITRQTLTTLRSSTLKKHAAAGRTLARALSLSQRQNPAPPALGEAVDRAAAAWPELAERLAHVAPLETYRRWLYVVQWRLRKTTAASLDRDADAHVDGAYASPDDLAADVRLIADSLQSTGNQVTREVEVQPWLDQIYAFGFHTARLDVRQHSGVYRDAFAELWQSAGMAGDPDSLDEDARERTLAETFEQATTVSVDGLSAMTSEMFEMFRVLRRAARRFGMAALGEHVVSMTKRPSDVLAVLWCWRWSEGVDGGDPRDREMLLPVVPLFETIADLRDAAQTLRVLLETPIYREHVRALGDRQTVMIGYSDSTKDGGYLAALWALFSAQKQLQRVAEEFGVALAFFHGRGGSLGRGGGPAARGILSLPTLGASGTLRLTEQGEVLAERYDDPEIAHRHLEQVASSVLTACSRPPQDCPAAWTDAMQALAAASLVSYRQLVDHERFADFFRAVTPVNQIERLPLGSRPAKRKTSDRIEDLRAIPWVFSWTQCRSLIPAWYGMGAAYEQLVIADPAAAALLQEMYREWRFFAAAIDNSALALAKANMRVFRQYARLGAGVPAFEEIAQWIDQEYAASRRAVLAIMNCDELLDDVPWLQRSIQVRNGYVDPLNLIQVELLERAARRGDAPEDAPLDKLEHLAHLTIKGVSAGMRTTG